MYRSPNHGKMPLTFKEGGGLLRQASWETHAQTHLEAQDPNSSEVVCWWRLTISQGYITSSAHPGIFLYAASWTWECVDGGFILGERTFSTLSLQPCAENCPWVAEAHGTFWNAEPNQTSACSHFWITLSKFFDHSPWCSQPLIWKQTYKLPWSRILLALIWL